MPIVEDWGDIDIEYETAILPTPSEKVLDKGKSVVCEEEEAPKPTNKGKKVVHNFPLMVDCSDRYLLQEDDFEVASNKKKNKEKKIEYNKKQKPVKDNKEGKKEGKQGRDSKMTQFFCRFGGPNRTREAAHYFPTQSMRIACWNVRGFHKALKQRSVQAIMATHKIDVIGILESKFDGKDLSTLLRIRFQGMSAVHNLDCDSRGRIMILWNSLVDVNIVGVNTQFVHLAITCRQTSTLFYATFVYGLNTIVERRPMWEELKLFGDTCLSPWMVLGDFNSILSAEEKKGGPGVTNYETHDFLDCVNHLDLTDLRFVGSFYTWMSPTVCKKLDRVLVNPHWITSNLDGIVDFMAPGCVSDHTLSLVTFLHVPICRVKPFRFFNMWALSDEYLSLVLDK